MRMLFPILFLLRAIPCRRTVSRKIFLAAWLALFLMPLAAPVQASQPPTIDLAGKDEIPLVPTQASYLYWDIPEEGEMPPNIPLEEARQIVGTDDEYILAEALRVENEYSDGTYVYGPMWARVILGNSGDEATRWRVDYRAASGDPVRIYAILADGTSRMILDDRWVTQTNADRYPRARLLASDPVEVPPGARVELWYDAEFGLAPYFYHRLVEENRFVADRQRDTAVFSALAGFRVALLLALLAFALVLRDRAALSYAGFHSGLLLTTFSNAGFDDYLLGLSDAASGIAFRLTVAVALVCYMLTLRIFLQTPARYPRYNRVLLASTAIGLLSLPLLSYMDTVAALNEPRAYVEAAIVAQFAMVAAFGMLLAIRDRLPGSALLLIASMLLIGLAVLQGLFAAQVLLLPPWRAQELVNLVLAIDGTVFAGALVLRAIELRRQRDAEKDAKISALADRAFLLDRLEEAEKDYADAVALAEQRRHELAATSHDLKQPLLSLQMALSKLKGSEGAAEGVSYIENVLRRNLENTRPASAPVEIQSGLSINRVMRNAAVMFEDEAKAHGIKLTVVESSVRIDADPVSLMRILTNLIANAVNHSGGNKILVGVLRRGGAIDLLVADNGRGIAANKVEEVFEKYRSREGSPGEGLGLSVVRELAIAAGWTVSAYPMDGRGTVFRVAGIKPVLA